MVIFHSYVSLPEGIYHPLAVFPEGFPLKTHRVGPVDRVQPKGYQEPPAPPNELHNSLTSWDW